jgi:hypothetical protein
MVAFLLIFTIFTPFLFLIGLGEKSTAAYDNDNIFLNTLPILIIYYEQPLPRPLRSWVAELALSCASYGSITSCNVVFGLLLLDASFQTGKQWKDEYSGKRLVGLNPDLSESFTETYAVYCLGLKLTLAPLSFNIPLDLIS